MVKGTEIEQVVVQVAGDDVLPLVKKLQNKSNVSEFKLADSLKLEINIVRNMLYRLYNSNLVSFTRKKDKKKGWYIYYWTFNLKNIKYLSGVLKRKKIEKLRERLMREQSEQFFMCPKECIRLDFEQSMNFEFKCPECGSLIELEDNSKKIYDIQNEIQSLESQLAKEGELLEKRSKKRKIQKNAKKPAKPVKKKPSKKKNKR